MENLSSYIFQSDLDKAYQLIQNGHDINGLYGLGNRPINSAIESDNPEALKFVIKNGADVNIDKGSVLRQAIDYCIDGMIQNNRTIPYPEALEMLDLLMKSGADPLLKNEEGERPIDVLTTYSRNDQEYLEKLKNFFRPYIPEVDGLNSVEN